MARHEAADGDPDISAGCLPPARPDNPCDWTAVWVAMQELGAALATMPDAAHCPMEVMVLHEALEDAQEVVAELAKGESDG